MTALENRSSSANSKRIEQLRRWEESETNRNYSNCQDRPRKIQFPLPCVFLAACASGDKEEVLRLLKVGADIDTTNMDGLTALHQACIDDNLEMVEFLVEQGADVNKGDNEGWTPLHATASCGFVSIAKYLVEHGADIAAVNNDGELAVDISESDELENMLQELLEEKGINCHEARHKEETLMLMDAKEWLRNGKYEDKPHSKSGASAIHVAASKGYIKVLDILIQAGADINCQDFEGWTPLHAAAHWGQKEACQILCKNSCDMDAKNYVGQTAFDLTDTDMLHFLEALKEKRSVVREDGKDEEIKMEKNVVTSPKKPSSANANAEETPVTKGTSEDDVLLMHNVAKAEHKADQDLKKAIAKNSNNNENSPKLRHLPNANVPNNSVPLNLRENGENDAAVGGETSSWWKTASGRNILGNRTLSPNNKNEEDAKKKKLTSSPTSGEEKPQEIVLRRTQSFEADEKFYRRYCELRAKINAGNSYPLLIPLSDNIAQLPTRSSSLKEKPRRSFREDLNLPLGPSHKVVSTKTSPISKEAQAVPIPKNSAAANMRSGVKGVNNQTASAPVTPQSSKLSPGNIFKNFFKSFVPPVRDEESETQRKAHAKRVRETRRSTQGVTLEEIKSAEQLVKKKQQQQQPPQPAQPVNMSPISEQQFMLEDARRNEKEADSSSPDQSSQRWTVSQPQTTETTNTTSVTLPLRKNNSSLGDDKEQDKENLQNPKGNLAAQAVIQRKRRPKRRLTGVVQVDADENDLEKLDAQNDVFTDESGNGERSSRLSSSSSLGDEEACTNSRPTTPTPAENGQLDYKKLYEKMLIENEKLREQLRLAEESIESKNRLSDSSSLSASRNSLTESEKRERRAMERKLSEMEEELKQGELIKQENQRLKDENGALIRVISKLSK